MDLWKALELLQKYLELWTDEYSKSWSIQPGFLYFQFRKVWCHFEELSPNEQLEEHKNLFWINVFSYTLKNTNFKSNIVFF